MREKTVHIYRPAHQAERKELKKSEQLLNWGMKSVSVALLTAAWWRCLASVFEIQIKKQSLGIWICFYCFIWTAIWLSRWKKYALPAAGCFSVLVIWKNQIVFIRVLNHFANAVIRLREEANESIGFYQEAGGSQEQMAAAAAFIIMPIIIIWAFVICSGRGRIISLLLIILPTVAAAALAYFPSKSSCLTLLLSTGVYMALCSGNWGKALAGRGIAAAVLLFAMLLLASKIGDRIEVQKALYEMEYQQARTQINETVIKKLEIIAKKDTTERQKEETLREPEIQENETNQGRSGARNQAGTYSDSSMSDLKALESYQPSQNTESYLITVEKKPVETLYYPERYGGIYNADGFWETTVEGGLSKELYQYPQSLTKLMELCKVQQVTSTEGAYQFISREFEENTKYDYKPGKTPANMDFAEYFLFENKKGFCVHFATTAVLMYRIFEVPARYVEGVAVPASAFEQTEDGRYQAEVTGSMRHAWCETYENGFTVREHTLAYNGPDAEKAGPAADSQRDPISIKRQITEGIVIIIVIVVALIGILLLQSGVRRRHKCKVFRILSDGVGVQQMYLNIYKIGKHQGLSGKEAVSEECFYHLREMYNEIRDEEWDWVRRMVLGILFNRQEPNRKENERMYDIYKKITTMAKKKEKGWRKFQYKYLYCLD